MSDSRKKPLNPNELSDQEAYFIAIGIFLQNGFVLDIAEEEQVDPETKKPTTTVSYRLQNKKTFKSITLGTDFKTMSTESQQISVALNDDKKNQIASVNITAQKNVKPTVTFNPSISSLEARRLYKKGVDCIRAANYEVGAPERVGRIGIVGGLTVAGAVIGGVLGLGVGALIGAAAGALLGGAILAVRDIVSYFYHRPPTPRLSPNQVYHAALGVFEEQKDRYNLKHVVRHPQDPAELGRVYQNTQDKTYTILYAAMQDVESHISDNTQGLFADTVVKNFAQQLQVKDPSIAIATAKKIAIVSQYDNGALGNGQHFVLATDNGKEGILRIDDSMSGGYAAKKADALKDLFKAKKASTTAHGWQSWWQTWQCGYYVTQGIKRFINGDGSASASFSIGDREVSEQQRLHKIGFGLFSKAQPVPTALAVPVLTFDDEFDELSHRKETQAVTY